MTDLLKTKRILGLVEPDPDLEPKPDIAICSECGWCGPAEECEEGIDGDWESGYYKVDLCPKCEDGGCVDDYDMSPKRLKEWEEWYKRNRTGLRGKEGKGSQI